jgi:hypothetical protein
MGISGCVLRTHGSRSFLPSKELSFPVAVQPLEGSFDLESVMAPSMRSQGTGCRRGHGMCQVSKGERLVPRWGNR